MCSRPSPLPSVVGQHVQVALLWVWGKAACAAPVAPALPLSTRGAGAADSLRVYWPVLHLRDTSQSGRSESTSTLTGLLAASVPGRKQVKHLTCFSSLAAPSSALQAESLCLCCPFSSRSNVSLPPSVSLWAVHLHSK